MLCDVYGKKMAQEIVFDSGNYFKTRMLDLVDKCSKTGKKYNFPIKMK